MQSKGTAEAVPNITNLNLDCLLEGVGLNADVLLARGAFFPVLPHPGLPTLARGGIASAESQGGDIVISDAALFFRPSRKDAHVRITQRSSATAIENVAF